MDIRKQYHFREIDSEIVAWDVGRLIALSKRLPIIDYPLGQISEIDEVYWHATGERPSVSEIAEHAKLIETADLSYPIILCQAGRVMDGMHRVCKALNLGQTTIKAVRFSEAIDPDYVGKQPDELAY